MVNIFCSASFKSLFHIISYKYFFLSGVIVNPTLTVRSIEFQIDSILFSNTFIYR